MALSDFPLYAITLPGFVPPPALISMGSASPICHGCEYGFGSIWVSRISPAACIRVNRATGTLTEISIGTTGSEIRGVAVGPSFVSVSDLPNGNVFIIDPSSTSVVATISGLTGPYGMCWDNLGNLYIADGDSSSGAVKKYTFSGATPTLAASTSIGARPMFPAIDGSGNIWVPCFYANHVVKLDLATLAIQANYTSGTYPYEAFRDGESSRMLVTENGYNSVVAYNDDGSNARCTMAISGSGPAGIRKAPGGNIYVCLSNANAIGVIYPNFIHTANVAVGAHPSKICFDGIDLWNINSPADSTLQRTSP